MANKITDGNLLKIKLSIFIEEHGATSDESLWKGVTNHEIWRTTALDQCFFTDAMAWWLEPTLRSR